MEEASKKYVSHKLNDNKNRQILLNKEKTAEIPLTYNEEYGLGKLNPVSHLLVEHI